MTARKSPSLSPTQIDVLWHPQADEAVLWQGRPDPMVLARSAFHTPLIAGYFALLALIGRPFSDCGHQFHLSGSVGVALAP